MVSERLDQVAPPGPVSATRIRNEIVLAAQRLIAERGIGGVTTRAIAEAARCA